MIRMLNHIKLAPLLLGLLLGIIGVLFIKPEQSVTYKYPTPETADKMIYKDKNNVCYRYKANQVDCDKNEGRLKDFPLNK
jgi:hypothetical protein